MSRGGKSGPTLFFFQAIRSWSLELDCNYQATLPVQMLGLTRCAPPARRRTLTYDQEITTNFHFCVLFFFSSREQTQIPAAAGVCVGEGGEGEGLHLSI